MLYINRFWFGMIWLLVFNHTQKKFKIFIQKMEKNNSSFKTQKIVRATNITKISITKFTSE